MAKRESEVVGVVEPAQELLDHEDAEALLRAQNKDLSDLSPKDLDAFLIEQFQTNTNPDGLPPIEWLRDKLKTKSAQIRYLHYKGATVKQIAHHLNIRYQHARNVLTTDLKRGPNEHYRIDQPADGPGWVSPTLNLDKPKKS